MNPTFVVAALAVVSSSAIGQPIKTLLITGVNNHNWRYTSRYHAETLEGCGRFDVDITDTPEITLADAATVGKYRLFVIDYNDFNKPQRLPAAVEAAFAKAVSEGVGVVAIHSANNAFVGWTDYEKLLGPVWREGTGHGKFHPFDVEWVDKDHAITKGLAAFSQHPDELYHKLVNVQKSEYHLLAQAMSAKDTGGTGNYEPMAFTLQFGKGRIFATPLGHVWEKSDSQKASISDPNFKILLCRGAEWAATGAVTLPTAWKDVQTHNLVSKAEAGAGWKSLFDGKTVTDWRGYKQQTLPEKGWVVKDGVLFHGAGSGGGDLCSREEFGDFEFECQWKVAKGGNSGIMYRCTEDHTYPWETGPEMQILDDENHADGKKDKTRAGTLYDVIACSYDVARPAGEWNTARIVAKGTHIQHFLNGFKVVDVDCASEEYKKAHAASKWPGMPDYNTKRSGHICLQDHGDEVSFRNIKVKKLD